MSVDRNTSNAFGGVGQFVVGTFTATSATQTFYFSGGDDGAPTLNAFQVRKVDNAPQLLNTTLPTPGNSFSVTGGTEPYSFSIVAGSLPTGLTLASTGMITGGLTGSSVGAVVIRVTDSLGAASAKSFTFTFDLGLPEIEVRRVVIQDVGGTNRMAIFEVTASDDVALAPYETDPLFTNASHAFEYRRKSGTGAFSAWETALYFPFNYPPAIPFDSAEDLRVEFRSIDAGGNRSRTIAYDIKKGSAATQDQTFGVSVGSSTTLMSDVGTSIIKLLVDQPTPTSPALIFAVDRDSSTVSTVATVDRTNLTRNRKDTLIWDTPLLDAAIGKLLPWNGIRNDTITDIVVCTPTSLYIAVNRSMARPFLTHELEIDVGGTPKKVAVGDVNGDGADDIVAVVYKTTGPAQGYFLTTFLNKAVSNPSNGLFTTAGFAPPTSTPIPLAGEIRALAAGDINGDGCADIALAYDVPLSGVENVHVFRGSPTEGLVAFGYPDSVNDLSKHEQIVDLTIANYSGHVTGHRDVIVGLVSDPDPMYPTATHVAKHCVLVHQANGFMTKAPSRLLSTLTLSGADRDVFNIAVGHLSDRVTPDIVSCQYNSNSPSGTIDTGFLPPGNAAGELNWMLGNQNGVQSFGTSGGRPRRIALANVGGTTLTDLVLANADSGNIEVQINQKNLLAAFPSSVVAAPTVPRPARIDVVPGGALADSKRGIANAPWTFSCTFTKPPVDLLARVEYQLDNGPWTTLAGGVLGRSGTTFKTTVSSVPVGLLRFRCWPVLPVKWRQGSMTPIPLHHVTFAASIPSSLPSRQSHGPTVILPEMCPLMIPSSWNMCSLTPIMGRLPPPTWS